MNSRVLELIKNPKNIQSEDLNLLKEEIQAFPYIQNIRALHLYGVHLYDKENYQKELSTTAAYTTDKKILYQLINGVIEKKQNPEVIEEKQSSKNSEKANRYGYKDKGFPLKRDQSPEKEGSICLLPSSQEVEHIYVNGERNRILFEGEENFLDEKNPEQIDLESTLESGTLVIQKIESAIEPLKEDISGDEKESGSAEKNAGEEFTPEVIIHEDEISTKAEADKVEDEEHISFHETETLTPETEIEKQALAAYKDIASENEVLSGNNIIEEDAELSFHGTDAFMPDVQIQVRNEEAIESVEISQPNVNKHEDEMRRLIEEVEKKMKESKGISQEEKGEQEVISDHEISFSETQSFHFWSKEKDEPANNEKPGIEKAEETVAAVENVEEVRKEAVEEKEMIPEVQSNWKPMNFETNLPDSLISKNSKVPEFSTTIQNESPVAEETKAKDESIEVLMAQETTEKEESPDPEVIIGAVDIERANPADNDKSVENSLSETIKEEAPVMNVSFFGTDISSLKVDERQKENKEGPKKMEIVQEAQMKDAVQSPIDSNVPGFINTWQSWLKIDRTEEIEKEKAEIKEKVIDAFIENNPKISQLKEESSYVVKERNDDISHLMTETLANLYFEQKLYTKAIKAFEILISKNPDKKEYFETKIQEIKDFRSKN